MELIRSTGPRRLLFALIIIFSFRNDIFNQRQNSIFDDEMTADHLKCRKVWDILILKRLLFYKFYISTDVDTYNDYNDFIAFSSSSLLSLSSLL